MKRRFSALETNVASRRSTFIFLDAGTVNIYDQNPLVWTRTIIPEIFNSSVKFDSGPMIKMAAVINNFVSLAGHYDTVATIIFIWSEHKDTHDEHVTCYCNAYCRWGGLAAWHWWIHQVNIDFNQNGLILPPPRWLLSIMHSRKSSCGVILCKTL